MPSWAGTIKRGMRDELTRALAMHALGEEEVRTSGSTTEEAGMHTMAALEMACEY